MVVLGWNEAMALLRSPLALLGVAAVVYLLVRAAAGGLPSLNGQHVSGRPHCQPFLRPADLPVPRSQWSLYREVDLDHLVQERGWVGGLVSVGAKIHPALNKVCSNMFGACTNMASVHP